MVCIVPALCRAKKADDIAVAEVAETPDVIDGRVGNSRFLAGEKLTEADTRLFPTLASLMWPITGQGNVAANGL
jgi:glutathionyl-hydroquinone reductase